MTTAAEAARLHAVLKAKQEFYDRAPAAPRAFPQRVLAIPQGVGAAALNALDNANAGERAAWDAYFANRDQPGPNMSADVVVHAKRPGLNQRVANFADAAGQALAAAPAVAGQIGGALYHGVVDPALALPGDVAATWRATKQAPLSDVGRQTLRTASDAGITAGNALGGVGLATKGLKGAKALAAELGARGEQVGAAGALAGLAAGPAAAQEAQKGYVLPNGVPASPLPPNDYRDYVRRGTATEVESDDESRTYINNLAPRKGNGQIIRQAILRDYKDGRTEVLGVLPSTDHPWRPDYTPESVPPASREMAPSSPQYMQPPPSPPRAKDAPLADGISTYTGLAGGLAGALLARRVGNPVLERVLPGFQRLPEASRSLLSAGAIGTLGGGGLGFLAPEENRDNNAAASASLGGLSAMGIRLSAESFGAAGNKLSQLAARQMTGPVRLANALSPRTLRGTPVPPPIPPLNVTKVNTLGEVVPDYNARWVNAPKDTLDRAAPYLARRRQLIPIPKGPAPEATWAVPGQKPPAPPPAVPPWLSVPAPPQNPTQSWIEAFNELNPPAPAPTGDIYADYLQGQKPRPGPRPPKEAADNPLMAALVKTATARAKTKPVDEVRAAAVALGLPSSGTKPEVAARVAQEIAANGKNALGKLKRANIAWAALPGVAVAPALFGNREEGGVN